MGGADGPVALRPRIGIATGAIEITGGANENRNKLCRKRVNLAF